jgi:sensor protein lytS
MRTLLIALFSFCFSTVLAQKADAETVRFIMSLDTLKENQQAAAIKQFIAETFPSQQGGNSPAYWLTKVRLLKAEKKKDSITYALNAVQLKDNQYELAVLHFVESLQAKNEYKSLAPHQTVKALLQQTQIAEQHHCRNVYRLYDELAKYAYLNALSFGNYTESKKYVQQYIDHHPYKQHPRVRQRYYDICCMIALSEKNISDFEKYYALAAPLAKKLNSPKALNRLHQFEAEYYKLTGKNAQSLAIMQQSFQVAKKRRNLSPQLLLNMSRTFLQNKQYDSAIYYSRKAIAMNRAIGADPANSFNYYRALNEAYKKKGDYRNAYYALDTVLTLFAAREKSIQADKNNELLTQFQTEKKDLQIRTLKINNELSEKRISQQKFLIIGALKTALEKSPLADKEFTRVHFGSEGPMNDVFKDISVGYFNPSDKQFFSQHVDAQGVAVGEPQARPKDRDDEFIFKAADIPYARIGTEIQEAKKFLAENKDFADFHNFTVSEIIIDKQRRSKFPNHIVNSIYIDMNKKGESESYYYRVHLLKTEEGGKFEVSEN